MRTWLGIIGVGLLTFVLVFALLELSGSAPGEEAPSAQAPAASELPVPTDSLAMQLAPGEVAVGVPISGSEPLLRDVRPGDHLDVLATVQSGPSNQPVTAVIVRGARVLRPAEAGDSLLLEVPAAQAMALAHLVLVGTHLGYLVWSPAATPPAR